MEEENKEKWKIQIDNAYHNWKYNNLHKDIKSYFNNCKTNEKVPQNLKYQIQEENPIGSDLNDLKDAVDQVDDDESDKTFIRDSSQSITFLGSKLEVDEEEADDVAVNTYCKETILSGFLKTIKKLCNVGYRILKSGLDILKKLFKKAIDFIEAGMQKIAIKIGRTVAKIMAWAYPLPDYEIHESLGVKCIHGLEFENTEQTITNTPQTTFFPKTVEEISKVVLLAKNEGKRIRAAGMKHSWTDLFSNNNEYLMYLLPLEVTDHLTFGRMGISGAESEIEKWGSELTNIEFIEELDDDGNHAAVRVGAGTTNLQMMQWSIDNGWTLPMDIIALMITYGGSNATITHGAGIKNPNLSDIVIKLEFVNALGELQIVDDPKLLKSVSGAFGLLGIVTSITFRMDKMTYARYHPKKTNMVESIPRPDTDPNDPAFQKMVDLCQNHYYAEFFWFPNNGYDDGYWENCWKNDGEENEAVDLNDHLDDKFQIASTYLFDVTTLILQPLVMVSHEEHYDQDITLREIIRHIFTKIISLTGHNLLPQPENPITTSLAEALHFRTGFHYIMVREMEAQIPIPSLPDGSPDFSIVSKAWWDAIDLIEKSAEAKIYACDMALELRIMGGSDVTMAPQFGNKHGTLSIEPVSTRMVHEEVWEDFKEELAEVWMSYKDFDGTPLNTRFHWAKESPRTIKVDGQIENPIIFGHQIYQKQMEDFFDALANLTEGVTIQDLNSLFSNKHLDQVFKPQWERFGVDVTQHYKNGMEEAKINQMENGYDDFVRPTNSSECCILS